MTQIELSVVQTTATVVFTDMVLCSEIFAKMQIENFPS
jgi:hypothetical protein